MALLAAAFFAVALLYASVGFGGGSSYTALLTLAGLDYRLIAPTALLCNLVVVTGGTIRFARAGLVPWRRAAPVIVLGAPAAFAGGFTPIKEATFLTVLGCALLASAAALLVRPRAAANAPPARAARFVPLAAAPLGYLAGLVGIGGGIFLAPLLHALRWDEARRVAATASLFILVNSLFGLAGQVAKGGGERLAVAAGGAVPLLLAVAVGGQLGGLMAQRWLPASAIRVVTAVLTAWVGARLLLP